MPDEAAFLAAVWDAPHDDTPRLVYADWLDETGEPADAARAEFIRLQCRLARTEDDDPERPALQARSDELEKEHRPAWIARVPAAVGEALPRRAALAGRLTSALRDAKFHRGFLRPEQAQKVSAFLRLSPDTANAAPAWNVRLTGTDPAAYAALAASPNLLRVGSLDLSSEPGTRITADDLLGVVRSPNARNLAALACAGHPFRGKPVKAIFDPGGPPALEALDLSNCRLNDEDGLLPALLASPYPEQFRELRLRGNHIEHASLSELFAAAGRFARLAVLDLNWNKAEARTVRALAAGPVFPALREFSLAYPDDPKDSVTGALAEWPGLANLRVLRIGGYPGMGPAGARALADSPHLTRLRELRYARAFKGWDETTRVLRDRFGDAFKDDR